MSTISGKLSIQRADNGWIVEWFEGATQRREVYRDWDDLSDRLGELLEQPALGA